MTDNRGVAIERYDHLPKVRLLSFPSQRVSGQTTCPHPKPEVGSCGQPDKWVIRTLCMGHAPFATIHSVEDLYIGQGGKQLFPVRPRRPSWSLSRALSGKDNNRWYDSATVWRGGRWVKAWLLCFCARRDDSVLPRSSHTCWNVVRLRLLGGISQNPELPWRTRNDFFRLPGRRHHFTPPYGTPERTNTSQYRYSLFPSL